MITHIKIIEPHEIRIYETLTNYTIKTFLHFSLPHFPNCPFTRFQLHPIYVHTIQTRFNTPSSLYFQERCKNSWEEQKIPDRDQYLEFHEQE